MRLLPPIRRARPFAVAAACLTLVLAASGTASADPGDASLLNPSEGWQYDTRWGGDALVDLNALGSYELRAAGPDGYAETRQIVAEAPSDLVLWKSVQFTPQTTLGDYTMTLWRTDVDPEEQLGQHSFQVVAPTAATIDAPADGATLFTDATTPISVTWQHLADPTGPRQISITRTQPVGGANSVCDFFGTITQGQTTDCPLPSPLTEGTYRVVAHDTPENRVVAESTFTVVTHLTLSGSVTPVVIYPVVAGGLADCTTYTYTVGKAATVNIAVKNASGTVVRHAGPFSDTAGAHTWKWCGRNDANKLVAAGVAYTPQVTATAGGETLTSTAHTVSVKTGYQDAVSPLERFGASNTGGGSGVFCFTHKRWYTSSDLFIRCNGGTVTVSYSFTLPAGTYRTTSSAVTTQPTCCKSPGTITRTATRSGNRMTVTFKVTGKRSLDIRSVRVTAHYKLHV